jgi:hypothetical protein
MQKRNNSLFTSFGFTPYMAGIVKEIKFVAFDLWSAAVHG